ncbi:ATP-binding protein [Brunnivagina elsteri]|uniref:histidine kinase n=1 Tax=Brunnivagina elsteri CCALA 953 TaxID=987040 RepID=A0A2A2TDD5_9CYAN|nr:ATP-binding protein [Calothrix elsteri]PAX51760.1 histidine kinase [Calothrix elsteri CCALA 953]
MSNEENHNRELAANQLSVTLGREQATELLENEGLYHTLLKHLPNHALMPFDFNLCHLLAEGEEVLTITGIDCKAIVGKTIWEILPSHICGELEPLYRQALAGEKNFIEIFDDRNFYQVNTVPVKNERGEIFAGMAIWQNISVSKRVEESLREREELNRSIFESSADCIKTLDLNACLLSMNAAGLCLMEIDDFTSYIGESWVNLWQEPDRSLVLEAIETAKADKIGRFQGFCPTVKGTAKWWDVLVTAVPDATGKAKLLVSSSRDITAQTQSEEALQQSEQILKTVLENLPVGVWITDKNGSIMHTNRTGKEIWAGTRHVGIDDYGEYKGFWSDSGEQIAAEEWALARAIKRGETSINEVVDIECFDGSRKTVLNSALPLYDNQGNITGGIAVNQDISEYRRIEAERQQMLVRSHQYANQLRGLTEAALAINSTFSIEEVLRIITEQARSIIGAHQSVTSTTTNQNWAQSISTISLSDKYAAWRDYQENPDDTGIYSCVTNTNHSLRMRQTELEQHPKWKGFSFAGSKHPPLRGWLAAPLVGRDGGNIGLIQLSDKYDDGEFSEEDESILVQLAQMASIAIENNRLYADAQKARSEAEKANHIKDEFLAVLSHELRSPLNPILGWSKILQTRKLEPEKTREALSIIERNAKLQGQLIEDLLDISRILQGKLTLNISTVNLKSVVLAALETVRLAAETKNIQIQMVCAVDNCDVLADSGRLQQVFWNLFTNAVKFTPAAGRVEVRIELSKNHLQVVVKDTGKGIAPDFLPSVFDHFRQADGATTRRFGGLGLGLAIVRQITEMHGGKAFAESPGEDLGAIFRIELPLSQKSQEEDNSTTETELDLNSRNLESIEILIVDDDADSREFITFVLETTGAIVTQATSALEALDILTQLKPKIIVSDIGMPEMDGYMLMRQIRNLPSYQGGAIPAVALTAYASECDREQAISAGFQKHVSKPIEPDELIAVVLELVRNK